MHLVQVFVFAFSSTRQVLDVMHDLVELMHMVNFACASRDNVRLVC